MSAILANHAHSAWREAHMRMFDVSAWRGGGSQPHADSAGHVETRVAEFATSPGTVITAVSNMAALFSPKAGQAVESAMQKLSPWSYSPQGFTGLKPQAAGLAQWAGDAAKPYRPAMLAIPDAAGVAMELNQLAIQRALEWTEQPKRQWELATATAITGLREAILNGAVKEQVEDQQEGALYVSPMAARFPNLYGPTPEETQAALKEASTISLEQLQKLGKGSWSKYLKMYNEPARVAFLQQYAAGFKALEQQTIQPLDTAYLAWLQSDHFKAHFTHNFDPQDIGSGMAYQALAWACIREASGRKGPSEYFKACLGNNPTDAQQVILRAMAFNQDKLVDQWNQAAQQGATQDATPWLAMGGQIYDGLKVILGKEHESELDGALAGISKYIYQLSGPVVERLTAEMAKGASRLLAALPVSEQRVLGMMQAVLRKAQGNEELYLVSLQGMQTRKRAARALAKHLARLGGGNEQQWRSSARALLKEAGADKETAWGGLFVVDKATLQEVQTLKRTKRVAGALEASQPTEFEALLESNAHYLVNREVAAGGFGLILAGVTMYFSYGELAKVQGAEKEMMEVSFGGGATAVIGQVGEISGKIMQRAGWGTGASAIAERLSFGRLESLAELAEGVGKLLGVVGGVIVGVVQMVQGLEAFNSGDVVFGVGTFLVGAGTLLLGIAVAFAWVTAGVGFILVLVLVAAGYVISLFKHDKIQHWLDSCYFGNHELDGEKYVSLDDQRTALATLANGN